MMGLEFVNIGWDIVDISVRVDFELELRLVIPSVEHSVDLKFESVDLIFDNLVGSFTLILLLNCFDLC